MKTEIETPGQMAARLHPLTVSGLEKTNDYFPAVDAIRARDAQIRAFLIERAVSFARKAEDCNVKIARELEAIAGLLKS